MTAAYDKTYNRPQKLEQKQTVQRSRAKTPQNMAHPLSEAKNMIGEFDDLLWNTMIEKIAVFMITE